MEFAWDPNKAQMNVKKHGVTFNEAATVLGVPLSITAADIDHWHDVNRCITVGMSSRFRLLMVAHSDQGDPIRIISARELTRAEREAYEKGSSS